VEEEIYHQELTVDNSPLGGVALGMLASELAWDAILASGPTQP
jgi:hypothetical protein